MGLTARVSGRPFVINNILGLAVIFDFRIGRADPAAAGRRHVALRSPATPAIAVPRAAGRALRPPPGQSATGRRSPAAQRPLRRGPILCSWQGTWALRLADVFDAPVGGRSAGEPGIGVIGFELARGQGGTLQERHPSLQCPPKDLRQANGRHGNSSLNIVKWNRTDDSAHNVA